MTIITFLFHLYDYNLLGSLDRATQGSTFVCRVSKKKNVWDPDFVIKKCPTFYRDSRQFLYIFLMRNYHFDAFQPVLVSNTYSILSLHLKNYRKYIFF